MVEFALVAPILLLLIVGIFKFGVTFNNYVQLTNAVDAGARQFAVESGQADPCTDVNGVVDEAAAGLTSANVTITMTDTSDSLTYTGTGGGSCPFNSTNLPRADVVELQASYPCDLTVLGINFYPTCSLKASATESEQ